ncbi:unnamed protein product, partial [Iphiclides podalirius]
MSSRPHLAVIGQEREDPSEAVPRNRTEKKSAEQISRAKKKKKNSNVKRLSTVQQQQRRAAPRRAQSIYTRAGIAERRLTYIRSFTHTGAARRGFTAARAHERHALLASPPAAPPRQPARMISRARHPSP